MAAAAAAAGGTTASRLLRPVRQWWTQSHAEALHQAQDALLKSLVRAPCTRLPTVAGVHGVEFVVPTSTTSSSSRTTMATRKQHSNDDNNHNNNPQRPPHTVVLAHGFGSGLGFFYNNIDLLLGSSSSRSGGEAGQSAVQRVLAVDWLGMGGSDRPSCRASPIRWGNGNGSSSCGWCDADFTTPTQAVDFFIDPFQEWMEQQFANNHNQGCAVDHTVTLVGHSLGGYLAARYIWKYNPSYVHRLVLASPVGFPPRPVNALTPGAPLASTTRSNALRVVDALWSRNVTPQQLVRMVGATRGRRTVQRALQARLPGSSASSSLLAEYLYHITVAEPSGEFAMNSLLEPVAAPDGVGVFAREPLSDILTNNDNHHSHYSPPSDCQNLSPIKVLYGEHDWMRPNNNETSARETLRQLQQLYPNLRHNASVDIMPNAGHHLYLENSVEFVRHVVP